MIKTEVIILTGENMGSSSNTFTRLRVHYPFLHDDLIDDFHIRCGIDYDDKFSDSLPIVKSAGMGNLVFTNTNNRIVIGFPNELTEMQIQYLEKIRSFLEDNIKKVNIFNIYIESDSYKNTTEEDLCIEDIDILIKKKTGHYQKVLTK